MSRLCDDSKEAEHNEEYFNEVLKRYDELLADMQLLLRRLAFAHPTMDVDRLRDKYKG